MGENIWLTELQTVRDGLVAWRRDVMHKSAHEFNNANNVGDAAKCGETLRALQEQIEAVDRAITDEKRIQGRTPSSILGR